MARKEFWNEKWTKLKIKNLAKTEKYEISNYGRIKSYKRNKIDGNIINGSSIHGYKTLTVILKDERKVSKYVHKLVGEHFLDKERGQKFVLHLDYDKMNNYIKNLRWASKEQKDKHQAKNPAYIESRKQVTYSKLTESQVRYIKKLIKDPKRKTRMKIIAKQFGISEMQLYRIKSGENWAHVKI